MKPEFNEYLAIDNATNRVEVRELTDVMAENLSEVATVVALNFLGSKTTVWRDRAATTEHVSRSTLMELKHRIVWRTEHLGPIS